MLMKESFKIENGIPLPTFDSLRPLARTILALEEDDSFEFVCEDQTTLRASFNYIATVQRKFPGRKFKSRRISETTRRIWRVE